MTIIEGSGSISQKHGSSDPDPDPPQNAWIRNTCLKILLHLVLLFRIALVINTLDPDWIRIGIKPKMLDPDPDQMNADPQPWKRHWLPSRRSSRPDL
jgi:hypothetical protein